MVGKPLVNVSGPGQTHLAGVFSLCSGDFDRGVDEYDDVYDHHPSHSPHDGPTVDRHCWGDVGGIVLELSLYAQDVG